MLRQRTASRSGVAAVELAVLLPLLVLLFVLAVDWSRVFYYYVVIDNCARNGAVYASDAYSNVGSPYKDITAAALADAPNVQPTPTVTSATGTDANGHAYAECTVSYTFRTVSNFPLVPSTTQIVRTVRVYQADRFPK
jgi:Flp pilus assembly protein TadG